ADLSGRLPEGVGLGAFSKARRFGFRMEAFWGARQSRADRAARARRPSRNRGVSLRKLEFPEGNLGRVKIGVYSKNRKR
ncbi:MAG: hypothetical protein C0407_17885, partial [Desulfobacca sp.]|nr:hypothetical protein [Desulfobacca sp.]